MKRSLTSEERVQALNSGFVYVPCECGNQLMVWPNTNTAPGERVSCKKCDNPTEYVIKITTDLITYP